MKNAIEPIVQSQLDAIKKEGNRANEQELNLEDNTDIYTNLYESGIAKEELARRILDQRNIVDSKDYFADTEKIQKANSYADFLINKEATNVQTQTEEHTQEMETLETNENETKNMKMEELTNKLNDKPENAEKNAEKVVDTVKTRLKQTIERYTNKIKGLNTANDTEKETLKKELETIKAEIKKEKENYEKAKNYFLGELKYTPEEMSKISTRRVRWGKKTIEGGVVTRTLSERLQVSTVRRRMTANKLIKKFNTIGDKATDGARFIMGFEKPRFLRYTGNKINVAVDKAGGNMGLKMNPQQFHQKFNTGKTNIFKVLDKGEKTEEEQKIIDAIKKRINYYGYAYARQRATEWTNPFIDAEKNASENAKIIQLNTKQETKAAA